MIVMKFGGSSLAQAERILTVAEIVRQRTDRAPVVVVSALGQVTDLLEGAVEAARRGDREAAEPLLADLERRHRWALAGSVESAERRHGLSLDLDRLFEDLRQRLRSVRVLREATPRAADALLSFGETLSARIVSAAFADHGLPAQEIDPRRVMLTDARFGGAEPDLGEIRTRSRQELLPLLEAGRIPVLGGFTGATAEGHTTTLGRGGSDTTAAVLGAALGAEEIQIWTDVDGLMSADPRLVPGARTLPRVSFAEAAELAFYGARVLHPASIAPAVERQIPVRVMNSMRPDARGTMVLDRQDGAAASLAAVASRAGVWTLRVTNRRMRLDPAFVPRILGVLDEAGVVPDLVQSSEVALTVVVDGAPPVERLRSALGHEASVEVRDKRAIICVVGSGLGVESSSRRRVLAALAEWEPEIVGLGGSSTSVTAVFPESALARAVRGLHARFFEEGGPT